MDESRQPVVGRQQPPAADKHEVYEQAQLGGRVGFGARPAVLVVDFQRCFVDPAVPGGGDFAEAIAATAELLSVARGAGVPILYTVTAYEDPQRDAGRFYEKCPTLRYAVAGSDMTELDQRLGRRPDEPVIVKRYASAFYATTVASYLTSLGIDTLILAGCTTSGCVRASAVDAMQHGYRTILARPCTADIAAEPHEASLFDIDAKYGDVVDLEPVLAYLGAARHTIDSRGGDTSPDGWGAPAAVAPAADTLAEDGWDARAAGTPAADARPAPR